MLKTYKNLIVSNETNMRKKKLSKFGDWVFLAHVCFLFKTVFNKTGS